MNPNRLGAARMNSPITCTGSRSTRVLAVLTLLSACMMPTQTASAAWPGPSTPGKGGFSFYQPNLTLESIEVFKVAYYYGDAPIVYLRVKNTGNTVIGSFNYFLYVHVNGSKVRQEVVQLSSTLLPGETRTFTRWLPVVPYLSTQFFGVYVNLNYDKSKNETTYVDNYAWHYQYQ